MKTIRSSVYFGKGFIDSVISSPGGGVMWPLGSITFNDQNIIVSTLFKKKLLKYDSILGISLGSNGYIQINTVQKDSTFGIGGPSSQSIINELEAHGIKLDSKDNIVKANNTILRVVLLVAIILLASFFVKLFFFGGIQ